MFMLLLLLLEKSSGMRLIVCTLSAVGDDNNDYREGDVRRLLSGD